MTKYQVGDIVVLHGAVGAVGDVLRDVVVGEIIRVKHRAQYVVAWFSHDEVSEPSITFMDRYIDCLLYCRKEP